MTLLRFSPERRLALLLGATALLWLLPGPAGRLVTAGAALAIVVAAAVDAMLLPSRGAIALSRSAPTSVGIGDDVDGTYSVVSHWPRALTVRLHDRVATAVAGGVAQTTLSLQRFGATLVPFTLTGRQRGRASLGDVGLKAHSRLGLVSVRYTHVLTDEILVTPSVRGVKRLRLLAMQHRLDVLGDRKSVV